MLVPNYHVEIGPEKFASDSENDIIAVKVVRSIGLPTDSCEVFLVEKNYSFKKNDNVKIRLGYESKLVPVFSGTVDNIEKGLSKVRLTALGLAAGFLRLRINRVFLNQTAGKIVRNLAQEANVNVQTVSDGISLPSYVVDEVANTYEHVLRLAGRCGFDAYMTDDEKLVFKPWDGGKKHTLEYAKEIISFDGSDFSPLYVGTRVHGESPASFRGSDTSHWLTKQEVKGEAGSGAVLSVPDPAVRDGQTAASVAKAKLNRLEFTFFAIIETVGNPEIRLGDTLTLKGVPDPAFQGGLGVRGIEHLVSKSGGFTTKIICWTKR